jgi:glycosyltransferase involved in cell wall biosynthesis
MRILFITQYIPFPEHSHGTYKRLKLFVDAIKDHAHIDFLFFSPSKSSYTNTQLRNYVDNAWEVPNYDVYNETRDPEHGDRDLVNDYLVPMTSIYKQQRFSGFVAERHVEALKQCLKNKPDRVFAHKMGSMCLLMKANLDLPPTFFDMDDIEHVYLKRSIKQPPFWWAKYLRYLNIPVLMYAEKKACQLAEKTFLCSAADKEKLSKLYRVDNIAVIENAVRLPDILQKEDQDESKTILYVGTYGYSPNVVAAQNLINYIYPLVKQEVPNVRILIAGRTPENIPEYQSSPEGVEFLGFVESLDEVYQKADLVCCPITFGAGTRIKIIEAAAYGKAIVSTSIGAEGLAFANNEEITIADSMENMAAKCVRLLKSKSANAALGQSARLKVEKLYGADSIYEKVRSVIC